MAIYEALIRVHPDDAFVAFMLALCYEQQQRFPEALHWAETAVAGMPDCLEPLQAAARVAVALEDHEKAIRYVSRSLALPEVTTGMPRDSRLFAAMRFLVRGLSRIPVVRRRLRPGALEELQPGHQAVELQQWKEWAHAYIARRDGNEPPPPGAVH